MSLSGDPGIRTLSVQNVRNLHLLPPICGRIAMATGPGDESRRPSPATHSSSTWGTQKHSQTREDNDSMLFVIRREEGIGSVYHRYWSLTMHRTTLKTNSDCPFNLSLSWISRGAWDLIWINWHRSIGFICCVWPSTSLTAAAKASLSYLWPISDQKISESDKTWTNQRSSCSEERKSLHMRGNSRPVWLFPVLFGCFSKRNDETKRLVSLSGDSWKRSRRGSPGSPAHPGHRQRRWPALPLQQTLGLCATRVEGKVSVGHWIKASEPRHVQKNKLLLGCRVFWSKLFASLRLSGLQSRRPTVIALRCWWPTHWLCLGSTGVCWIFTSGPDRYRNPSRRSSDFVHTDPGSLDQFLLLAL